MNTQEITQEDAVIALETFNKTLEEGEWELRYFYSEEGITSISAIKNFNFGYGYDADPSFADASQFESLSDCKALEHKLYSQALEEIQSVFESIENKDVIIDLNFDAMDLAFYFGVRA